jgi:uncharacterized protein (DUF2236 family)
MTVARRINGERVVVLGWSRAILLQLAHPLIAAGVAEHSAFRGNPIATAARLHHTIRAMLSLTFGDAERHRRTIDTIRAIHRRVNGRLSEDIGPYPAGTSYSAEDPDLLLWVHATLLDSSVLAFERFVAPLAAGERDAYCDEAAGVAIELGARAEQMPRRWDALQRHLDRGYQDGSLAVGGTARDLAHAVLRPPLAWTIAPVSTANRLVTVGLLPPAIRAEYGFPWTARDDRRLASLTSRLRRLRGALPAFLALWPDARR